MENLNEIAISIRNNIETIIYRPNYKSAEDDLNELFIECLRMSELLVKITENNEENV